MITAFKGEHAFLSNFYVHPFQLLRSDHTYKSAEHAFQAAKATSVFDYQAIMQAHTPAAAKLAGQKVAIRPDWEQEKKQIMLEILLAKFRVPELRRRLDATRPDELIEGNTWGDLYWGAEPYTDRSVGPMFQAGDRSVWVGSNWLGRILMMTREVLT